MHLSVYKLQNNSMVVDGQMNGSYWVQIFGQHNFQKGDTLEASKSAHPFERNTVKPMHCTDVNQVATDMLGPYLGITKGFGFEI